MEDPVLEIPQVIHSLTQTPPSVQRQTVEHYFTPTASFTHPFCRTGSFNGSRWLIWCVYRWYKIMSPRIELTVDSVAYDATAMVLYVQLRQVFKIWAIPYHSADVNLVTVLHLEKSHSGTDKKSKYYIKSQNDLYQVNEFVKFFSILRIAWVGVFIWQFVATAMCVLGSVIGWPISWVEENALGGNNERSVKDVVA